MFNFAVSRESLLSGFQWFFFIFCNTVVVPPTLLSAFQLPQSSLLTLTQYAFLSTADREIELLQQDIEQEKQKKKALMQLLLTGIVRVKT